MGHLDGKVALVTGAGGQNGIGRAIARRLAEDGADVAVNDLVAKPRQGADWLGLPAVVAEIEALGRRSLAIAADVADAAQVDAMVHRVVDELGGLDIMVTNAGTPAGRDRVPIVDLEQEHWDRVLRVNATGTFLCCRAAARAMIAARRGGRIITMSSVTGKRGVARFGAYASSKFAVIGLTQVLAHELGAHGITVNALCPGTIDTERFHDIAEATRAEGTSREQQHRRILAGAVRATPLGRVGTATDVARAAAFLAGPDSEFMTGLAVPVAGGMYMQ
ncbi:MAG: SDR family oxidoreductase [Spirochaetaceae bacterium]|nr:SDR family oxidoreductase [Spirochaetaceae bacterium]MDE0447932.1 SDR family oxidoreductase [Spirochaetaceae bacterium]